MVDYLLLQFLFFKDISCFVCVFKMSMKNILHVSLKNVMQSKNIVTILVVEGIYSQIIIK